MKFDEPRLEAISTLAYLAAVTSRIRLGVAVLVLPQRQPVLLAKQLTTVDVLSAGRLTVGVGVGYLAAELAAFGVDLSDRGAMTDEFLQVLQALWSHRDRHVGRWVSFDGVLRYPVPAQRPHPPIVVGGHARAGLDVPRGSATAGSAGSSASTTPARRSRHCTTFGGAPRRPGQTLRDQYRRRPTRHARAGQALRRRWRRPVGARTPSDDR